MADEWQCGTAEELRASGSRIGEGLSAGEVVALTGDLGAGKTEFTKGLAQGLNYQEEVTSPTFALLQEYHGGRLPVFHLDFYRLESAAEVLDLGWDELLERGGVVVVEWPERFPELLPAEAVWVAISHDSKGGRFVKRGGWGSRPVL